MITLDQAGRAADWATHVPAPPLLRTRVERATVVHYPEGFTARDWLIVPDPSAYVIVGEDTDGRHRARVVGPRSVAARFPLRGRRWMVAVRLVPGAVSGMGGGEAQEWTDRVADLADVVPARLRVRADDVAGASAVGTRDRLLSLLAAWARDLARPDWRVSAFLRSATPGARVSDVSDALGISARGLRAAVGRHAGLPPKRLLRIRRLHAAAWRIAHSGHALAGIASATGFVDQAHMTRDFVDLLGEPASAFRRRGAHADPYKSGRRRPCDTG